MVGYFEINKSIKSDRNRIRNRQRFCVVQCEDLQVLYYREHEMRAIKLLQLSVVAKEELWDILEKAHNELYHARRDRMHSQWVGVLHYVQYSKNISHHRGINATPYSVHWENTARYQCRYVTTQGRSATTRDRGSTGAGPRQQIGD